ncbi:MULTISPECIES: thioredoxin family protein [unclassified Bacillus (in: firmicutes)]|uniref:thioredoxin family protein n=1 Tax=unclassified Bacillus (in: firmicutes) TaxID=185979 RepID=UPI0008F11747|nr:MULTISPECIES: thioredoxin family protein [unclassified Bacillus (in: firmicutes)]SFB12383.1 Thioredoxin [Bacillus sp. UNCCL13]SFQ90290.1 Thioredoxin [Bacillus sp. cl95]
MIEWTKEEFNDFLKSQSTGLAYFYTPLCGTCAMASKMLEVTEAVMPELKIAKIDLNYIPELALKFKVMSVPCLVFIKEGEVKEMIYAFRSVPYLLTKVREFFA